MKKIDQAKWYEKNKKLNDNVDLTIGTRVKDVFNHKGVVVKIEEYDNGDGCVYVWQEDRDGYGLDNCEHFHLNDWKQMLRIIK